MILYRRAKPNDLEGICKLPQFTGAGFTTLPDDPDFLAKRLASACHAFDDKIKAPHDEYYLFVLESISPGQATEIIGVSAIEASAGSQIPFYSYTVSQSSHHSEALGIHNNYQFLTLSNDNEAKTKLCTLFLKPDFRHSGNGLLLSRARFLFIAAHPERFTDTIIAELRGVVHDNGLSPFWEHVGKHFFQMPFAKADRLTLTTNKQFIADLMPQIPIYINLLPAEAQEVIGQPHPAGLAALNILMREGFHWNHTVDVFDAGPTLEAPIDQIETIRQSQVATVKSITHQIHQNHQNTLYIIANDAIDFRATVGKILIHENDKSVTLDQATADLLKIKVKQAIRFTPLLQSRKV